MTVATLIVLCVAFLGGTVLAEWRLPRLALTPAGRLCFRATTFLLGAASAVATATVWEAIRIMQKLGDAAASTGGSSTGTRTDILLGSFSDLALRVGLLAGIAAVIYVLGPPDRQS